MKKEIIILMLSVAVSLTSPVLAMDDSEDSNSFCGCLKTAETGEVHETSTNNRVEVRTMLNHHKIYELNIENSMDYKGLVASIENLFHKKPTTLLASGMECPGTLITEETWESLRRFIADDEKFTIWLTFRF